jgi:hypothetical protein
MQPATALSPNLAALAGIRIFGGGPLIFRSLRGSAVTWSEHFGLQIVTLALPERILSFGTMYSGRYFPDYGVLNRHHL